MKPDNLQTPKKNQKRKIEEKRLCAHFLSDIVSNDRRRRSPHNCTTEETARNSHRADSSCTLYPREKIGNTDDQMKETFVILIRLVRLWERWEDLGLKGVGGL